VGKMAKICWKCQQKIGILKKKNRFLERADSKKIWLHNDCYLKLNNDEMKQISYDIKTGPPSALRKNLKLTGFLVGGVMGGLGYSEGAFSGAMWATKRALKNKGMSFEELDDMCIDKYGYHYPILPDKLQNEVLANIRNSK
jgi:hypothetical protein